MQWRGSTSPPSSDRLALAQHADDALAIPPFAVFASLGLLDTLTSVILAHTAAKLPVAICLLIGFVQQRTHRLRQCARFTGRHHRGRRRRRRGRADRPRTEALGDRGREYRVGGILPQAAGCGRRPAQVLSTERGGEAEYTECREAQRQRRTCRSRRVGSSVHRDDQGRSVSRTTASVRTSDSTVRLYGVTRPTI
jgi:hypothetical protein